MTDYGFTPGPWAVDARYLSEVQTAENKTIASCWHKWADNQEIRVTGVLCCSLEESAANARLIAASPTLLEAAIGVLATIDVQYAAGIRWDPAQRDALRAAITLATGKGA